MKSALVTGSAGFLGRTVCRQLAQTGWKVLPTGHAQDLSLPPPWSWLPSKADVVIHLAQGQGAGMVPVAVQGTAGLLDWARDAGVRSFILASSQSAALPLWEYGESKQKAERMVLDSGLPQRLALRFHTLYGPGQSPERLIPRLEAALKEGRPIEVLDPDGIRLAPTHVEEAAEAVLRCLRRPGLSGTLSIPGPEELTVGEIVRRLAAEMGTTATLVPRPPQIRERDLVGSGAPLEAALGWRPLRRFP